MSLIATLIAGHKPTLAGRVTLYNSDIYRPVGHTRPGRAPKKGWAVTVSQRTKHTAQILAALAAGEDTQDKIAFRLGLSKGTVCNILKTLLAEDKVTVETYRFPYRYRLL